MTDTRPLIVVGVDGSKASDSALQWALDEARRRGATIEAIHVWAYPAIGGLAAVAGAGIDWEDLALSAKKVLTGAITRVVPDADERVPIVPRAVEGAAALVLIEAARRAELLVVGTRGHGGFAGLLLGSVSQQCAHHAPCPLVLVPSV